MSADGQIEMPFKGLSEVDVLPNGYWVMIVDTENSDTPTVVLGNGVANTPVPLSNAPVAISAALAATENAFNPASWLSATIATLTPFGGGSALNGMLSAGLSPAARIKTLLNTSLTDSITIAHESLSASANDRFRIPGGGSFIMSPESALTVYAHPGLNRWLFI